MKYINISHNDLDGIMCNIVLSEHFGVLETFHVSYGSVAETLRMVEEDLTHLTKVLFVTDLSLDVESFNILLRIMESNEDLRVIYIDHHPYEGEAADCLEELRAKKMAYVKHEIGTSATKLTFQFTKSTDEKLEKLVDWTDAYDIYKEQEDPANFKMGWFLNTVFWELGAGSFKFNIKKSEYEVPKLFKQLFKDHIQEKKDYFKKLVDNGLVIFNEDDSLLISFSDRFKSSWQMDYPQFDYFILPYHTKGNNISIRISSRVSDEFAKRIKEDVTAYVSQSPWHVSSGGHHHAFGITLLNDMTKDEQLSIIEGIAEIISKYNAEYNAPF
jgi:oligoribonuclease NrnB/cAMP/cGMP phosphodiesterase (DHH superfamily)